MWLKALSMIRPRSCLTLWKKLRIFINTCIFGWRCRERGAWTAYAKYVSTNQKKVFENDFEIPCASLLQGKHGLPFCGSAIVRCLRCPLHAVVVFGVRCGISKRKRAVVITHNCVGGPAVHPHVNFGPHSLEQNISVESAHDIQARIPLLLPIPLCVWCNRPDKCVLDFLYLSF